MKKFCLIFTLAVTTAFQVVQADDEPVSELPKIRVSASDPVAFANLTTGAFSISRDGTNGDLNVKITLGGSAVNGVDYTKIADNVTIPAGFHAVFLVVQPTPGGDNSPNKNVELTISEDPTYEIVKSGSASVLIRANIFEDHPPTVVISAPADNTSVGAHSDVTITADVNDPDGGSPKVSFYANERFLGKLTASPYSLVWSNVPAGKFALFARAEDALGKSSLSTAVHLTVTNPPVNEESLKLTAPADGSSFKAGSDIKLEASVDAATLDGVSFYAGDHLLGTAATPPYTFTWTAVRAGHYSLVATGKDAAGTVYLSQHINIAVTNELPKVSITAPADGAAVASSTDVAITADASSSAGIASVMFFADSRFLGSVKAAPYSLTWSNVPPGKHLLVAKATDLTGTAALSAPVTIMASNSAPTVKLTAPLDGASMPAPAKIDITAEASDSDGIAYVSFWSGRKFLGFRRRAPYTITLNGVPPGIYTLTAEAVDRFGGHATSPAVKVTVTGTP